MDWLVPDWHSMFSPGPPVLEAVLRGALIYAGLFILLRVVARREVGTISLSDLLLVNLVAEAASNGLQGEGKSVPSALLTAGTTVLCAYAVDWMSYRWRWFRQVTDPPAKPLVRDGQVQHKALEEELIPREQLASAARKQGLEDVGMIKHATMEPDGRISVIPKRQDEGGSPPPDRPARWRRRKGPALERLWAMQRKVEAQQARIAALLQEMMLQPRR